MKLAKETNTTLSQIEDSTRIYDERGHPIDEEQASKASDVVWSIIAEAFKYSNANWSSIAPNISLKDFFIQKLDEDGVPQDDKKLIMRATSLGSPKYNGGKYKWRRCGALSLVTHGKGRASSISGWKNALTEVGNDIAFLAWC